VGGCERSTCSELGTAWKGNVPPRPLTDLSIHTPPSVRFTWGGNSRNEPKEVQRLRQRRKKRGARKSPVAEYMNSTRDGKGPGRGTRGFWQVLACKGFHTYSERKRQKGKRRRCQTPSSSSVLAEKPGGDGIDSV